MGEQVGAGFWGCSSVGRAPALQAGGQGFESLHLHVNSEKRLRHMSQTVREECLHSEMTGWTCEGGCGEHP